MTWNWQWGNKWIFTWHLGPEIKGGCMHAMLTRFTHVQLLATLSTIAHQACCPWDFPGKNTGVGCYFLFQEIFLTQGFNLHLLCLLHCRWILYHGDTRVAEFKDCLQYRNWSKVRTQSHQELRKTSCEKMEGGSVLNCRMEGANILIRSRKT